jgi:hypothetical protein
MGRGLRHPMTFLMSTVGVRSPLRALSDCSLSDVDFEGGPLWCDQKRGARTMELSVPTAKSRDALVGLLLRSAW